MEDRSFMMKNEKISKLLFKMSMPAIVGFIVMSLYNMVDTIYIGRGVGKIGIAALTVTYPIQIITLAFAQMIGLGGSSFVSRALGENNKEKANLYFNNSIVLGLIIMVIYVALGFSFLDPLLKLFGAKSDTLPYAKEYMEIIFCGVIFNAFAMIFNNFIRAEGHAKSAMKIMLVGTIVNIFLDPILIFNQFSIGKYIIHGFGLGIKGAALATIISQISTLICAVYMILSKKSVLKIKVESMKLKFSIVKDIITIGMASFSRQIANTILGGVLNNILVTYGTVYLAIVGIIQKVNMLLFMPLFGISSGAQPIIGFNYGSKDYDRIKKTIRISVIWMTTLLVIGVLIILAKPELLVRIFTKDLEVIEKGKNIIKIMSICIPVIAIQIISAAFYQSVGKAKQALFLALIRQVILFIPMIIILSNFFGIMGVWISYPISDVLSTLISYCILKRDLNKM